MRMPAPSCHGHRYIGAPLAQIGSERRKPPPSAYAEWKPEGRWIPNRRSGSSTCQCDGLLADILDPPTWDGCPRQAATRLGGRMPGPPPRPERSATSDGRRGTQPTGHPQARTTETTLRPATDSAEDDEDRGPDVVKSREVHWPQPGLLGQIERDEDCHVPRCPCGYPRTQAGPCGPRGGSPPVTSETGSSSRPSRWIIAKTEKQEDGRLPQ